MQLTVCGADYLGVTQDVTKHLRWMGLPPLLPPSTSTMEKIFSDFSFVFTENETLTKCVLILKGKTLLFKEQNSFLQELTPL